ncbi:hypothetical protein [Sediminicurvatus halobius]|uniref:Uncharacterized protein n=1 Tax=Sediminicurvatus halobius TaxID=2182432 RepID=A0A2U2MY16_9GAMM|nr:hypothetical protein [Spiribacter halobius]PWG61770.1 hypothetical protein DEM34_14995 [Spiribacter halobius]UEX76796.1 hypothetical protein LMH63_12610 [Spiribacter halobius]
MRYDEADRLLAETQAATFFSDVTLVTATGAYCVRGTVRHNVEVTDAYGSVLDVQHLVSLERAGLPVWPRRGDGLEMDDGGRQQRWKVVQVLGYDPHEIRVAAA